ncbi:hypothetical protein LZ31DRAFT_129097 [Colletotrichum somersetense]|nr:hypothetical protein LZ31DRAFT_129097 [Colletotrichum somersetense]
MKSSNEVIEDMDEITDVMRRFLRPFSGRQQCAANKRHYPPHHARVPYPPAFFSGLAQHFEILSTFRVFASGDFASLFLPYFLHQKIPSFFSTRNLHSAGIGFCIGRFGWSASILDMPSTSNWRVLIFSLPRRHHLVFGIRVLVCFSVLAGSWEEVRQATACFGFRETRQRLHLQHLYFTDGIRCIGRVERKDIRRSGWERQRRTHAMPVHGMDGEFIWVSEVSCHCLLFQTWTGHRMPSGRCHSGYA